MSDFEVDLRRYAPLPEHQGMAPGAPRRPRAFPATPGAKANINLNASWLVQALAPGSLPGRSVRLAACPGTSGNSTRVAPGTICGVGSVSWNVGKFNPGAPGGNRGRGCPGLLPGCFMHYCTRAWVVLGRRWRDYGASWCGARACTESAAAHRDLSPSRGPLGPWPTAMTPLPARLRLGRGETPYLESIFDAKERPDDAEEYAALHCQDGDFFVRAGGFRLAELLKIHDASAREMFESLRAQLPPAPVRRVFRIVAREGDDSESPGREEHYSCMKTLLEDASSSNEVRILHVQEGLCIVSGHLFGARYANECVWRFSMRWTSESAAGGDGGCTRASTPPGRRISEVRVVCSKVFPSRPGVSREQRAKRFFCTRACRMHGALRFVLASAPRRRDAVIEWHML